jgi:hypothetical protein
MATPAQVIANRTNAQLSTGPKTQSGKTAAAQNSVSHGLSATRFAVLPHEDPDEYAALLQALTEEFEPDSTIEDFLVEELARAQWKLRRVQMLENEILAGSGASASSSDLARRFSEDCSENQVLAKLNRYEQAARRALYKALEKLMDLQKQQEISRHRQARTHAREMEALVSQIIAAPLPRSRESLAATQNFKTDPMPKHLQQEMEAHQRRDPLFDPVADRSQMSKELRKYFGV